MNLALCELYNPNIHHYSSIEEEWKNQSTHWLNIHTIHSNYNFLKIKKQIKRIRKGYLESNSVHPYIRNYQNIIKNNNYIQIHLVKNILLSTGETICIIKTYWLRIIQRTWKRVYKKRKEVIEKRKSIYALTYFQLHGKWPNVCLYIPKLIIS